MPRARFAIAGALAVLLAAPVLAGTAQARDAAVPFGANALPTWQADGVVWALASSGNTVYAGGTFTHIRPPGAAQGAASQQPAISFAAFDARTGNPLSTCHLAFRSGTGTGHVRTLDVSPDRTTLYAGGLFSSVNGVAVSNIAAISIPSCVVKTSFRPSVTSWVHVIRSTGSTVYAGGEFLSAGSTASTRQPRTRLAAFTPTGSLTGWKPAADGKVNALVVSPDATRVAVGGKFETVNGGASRALGVVNATTGATVRLFGGFIMSKSAVKDLVSDAGQNAFYTANEGSGGGVFDGRIALSWADYHQIWRDRCLGATQALVIRNGLLFVGSHAHDCSSMGEWPDGRRQHLEVERLTDPHFLPWYPDTNEGIGEGLGPRDLALAADGAQLWVSGEFTRVNGVAQQSLTRFGTGADVTKPSVPVLTVSSPLPGTVRVSWPASVDPDDRTLTYTLYRDEIAVRTYTGNSTWWSRPTFSITETGLASGSTHSYQMTAGDGTTASAKSAARTVQVW